MGVFSGDQLWLWQLTGGNAGGCGEQEENGTYCAAGAESGWEAGGPHLGKASHAERLVECPFRLRGCAQVKVGRKAKVEVKRSNPGTRGQLFDDTAP